MFHICHISTTFNLRSGSARRTLAIIKGCISEGYRITLICGRANDVESAGISDATVIVIPELVKCINFNLDLRALLLIFSALKDIKPDIVHTHLAKAGVIGRLAAYGSGVPRIFHTVHGPTFIVPNPEPKDVFYKYLERLCGFFTDYFVFVGKELREMYVHAHICKRDRSEIIYTGRSVKDMRKPKLTSSEKNQLRFALCDGDNPDFIMMSVGRLVPSKRYEHAILLTERLFKKGMDVHLVIVGECLLPEERSHEEKLRNLAGRRNINSRVHFAGFRNDVLPVISVADAILITSGYEGLSNVSVEALIANTPILAYSVLGIGEILEQGKTGYMVGNGDIHSMGRVLERMYENRNCFQDFENYVPTWIWTEFKKSMMIKRKLELYGDALSNNKKRCFHKAKLLRNRLRN